MDEEKELTERLKKKAMHSCPVCGGKAYEAGYPGGVAVCLGAHCGAQVQSMISTRLKEAKRNGKILCVVSK